jgi:hypothetical protein
MEYQKANKVIEAVFTLANFLEIKPEEVISPLCFLNEERFNKIKEANNLRNKFQNMTFAERGRALGYNVIENEKGVKISTTL